MTLRIAINGFGRIGRAIFRAWVETQNNDIDIVAINDLADPTTLLHLLQYDSVHGPFKQSINQKGDHWSYQGKTITLTQHKDPETCPWQALNIDMVFECTGFFTTQAKAQKHLNAGAKKVLISAPGGQDVSKTIVFGVNHHTLSPSDTIVSNASCTTNCLAPIIHALHTHYPINSGLMTTIHAFTSDQRLTDAPHADLRRARAATQSMIPTKTGAAKAIGLVMPELKGKLDGYAMRVPTINVSVVDFTFETNSIVDASELNDTIKQAVKKDTQLAKALAINEAPLVSIDFNHNPASAIFDATQTRVIQNENSSMVKILAWYDNEWGFSNRMLDTATYWLNKAD